MSPRKLLELWPTHHFVMTYDELTLPCRIENGKLIVSLEFDRFEWLEGDSGDSKKEPYDGDGEPHAISATSSAGDHRIDITVLSPAAKALLRANLVPDAPKDAL